MIDDIQRYPAKGSETFSASAGTGWKIFLADDDQTVSAAGISVLFPDDAKSQSGSTASQVFIEEELSKQLVKAFGLPDGQSTSQPPIGRTGPAV